MIHFSLVIRSGELQLSHFLQLTPPGPSADPGSVCRGGAEVKGWQGIQDAFKGG